MGKIILTTEDAFAQLGILREKATTAIVCAVEFSGCPRVQTLGYIANDYVVEMGNSIQAMQESKIAIPPSPAQRTSR